jgi:WD40 repeat protein
LKKSLLLIAMLLRLHAEVRVHPVTALAESPVAPIAAVAGHDRIYLFDIAKRVQIGELPFPEGIPYVLRFSRDGATLLAGGGRGVQNGEVALYDVRTQKRIKAIGQEHDIVLAADISADGKLVALGGPSKMVKVFSVADGKLLYEIKQHSDWITALEFSPDGSKLATADRAGGVFLWDSATGSIIVNLAEHKDSVTSLSWKSDGRRLASGSEDGELVLWDAQDGFPISTDTKTHIPKPDGATYGKPAAGILGVAFRPDGTLVTIGRDRVLHTWSTEGKPQGASKPYSTMLTKVAVGSDNKLAIAGDYDGHLILWDGTALSPVN